MSADSIKILVAGDVVGKFNSLFSRVRSVLKKNGQFDMLLCVGEFFNGAESIQQFQSYINGKEKVPIPTYILGPCNMDNCIYYQDINGCELCPNLTYLGKTGIYTSSSGLQIAYLSGKQKINNDINKTDAEFNNEDIQSLIVPMTTDSRFKGVDILLTSQWARNVEKYSTPVEGEFSSIDSGSEAISQLCLVLKPRYHFVGLEGYHYERAPYRNHQILSESTNHVTRYIALAPVGNREKRKFLYAFSIKPMSRMDQTELTKQPDDVTERPYTPQPTTQPTTAQPTTEINPVFFDTKSQNPDTKRKKQHQGGQGRSVKKHQAQPTGPCWFCLGSPQVEKHLVVSVGENVYLALAKGGLVPDHVLILPIGHYQSTVSAPDDVVNEINSYKKALRKMFKQEKKEIVSFERNYRTQHLQIQVVPIPVSTAGDELKESFLDCAQSQQTSFELHEIPKMSDIKQIVPEGAPYFYVELPSGDKLLHRIKKSFPLQFGREVLAGAEILDMTDRIDWRNCKYSIDEEKEMAAEFRKLFQKYDFNL
ncbi:CWF19-like protein 1 [Tubulanus polymorphus]|uniref:CWF19-like protein 1 n=1 Tax=Tubulanus polymorphus TaxID=672921 RepID=UPI003DA637ED